MLPHTADVVHTAVGVSNCQTVYNNKICFDRDSFYLCVLIYIHVFPCISGLKYGELCILVNGDNKQIMGKK